MYCTLAYCALFINRIYTMHKNICTASVNFFSRTEDFVSFRRLIQKVTHAPVSAQENRRILLYGHICICIRRVRYIVRLRGQGKNMFFKKRTIIFLCIAIYWGLSQRDLSKSSVRPISDCFVRLSLVEKNWRKQWVQNSSDKLYVSFTFAYRLAYL